MPKRKAPKRNNNLVIAFDDQARREHLTGFSARKRARRIHGLAQQKRKEQLALRQHRADRKEAEANEPTSKEEEDHQKIEETVIYQDNQTQDQWGGNVIVTATSELPEDEAPLRRTGEKGEDTEQEYACSLERFVNQVKGNLPGKRGKRSKPKGTKAVTKNGGDAKVVAKNLLKQKTRKKTSKKR